MCMLCAVLYQEEASTACKLLHQAKESMFMQAAGSGSSMVCGIRIKHVQTGSKPGVAVRP